MPQWSIDLLIAIISLIAGLLGGFYFCSIKVKQKTKGNNNTQKVEINYGKDTEKRKPKR